VQSHLHRGINSQAPWCTCTLLHHTAYTVLRIATYCSTACIAANPPGGDQQLPPQQRTVLCKRPDQSHPQPHLLPAFQPHRSPCCCSSTAARNVHNAFTCMALLSDISHIFVGKQCLELWSRALYTVHCASRYLSCQLHTTPASTVQVLQVLRRTVLNESYHAATCAFSACTSSAATADMNSPRTTLLT
jgi:hypothetical protein